MSDERLALPDQHDEQLALQAEYAQGHLWTVTATSRGVHRSVGGSYYAQANWESEPLHVQVRAFDLRSAMEKAAQVRPHLWNYRAIDEDGPLGQGMFGLHGILNEFSDERLRQLTKHGNQSHLPDGTGENVATWEDVLFDTPSESADVAAGQLANWARCRCQAASETTGDGSITFEHILTEEYFEALAESDPQKLRAELVQLGTLAAQWIQAIDGRPVLDDSEDVEQEV